MPRPCTLVLCSCDHLATPYYLNLLSSSPREGPNYSLSIYRPEHKGLPAQIRLYHYPKLEDGQQVATKAFFNAESVEFKWEARGRAVLVRSSTAVRILCLLFVSVFECVYISRQVTSLPLLSPLVSLNPRLTRVPRGSSLARASTTALHPCTSFSKF